MQFKKIIGSLFLSLCLGLIGTSVCFLSIPAGVSASGDDPPILEESGTCTAKCLGGTTVTCKGKDCTAIDNQGCSGGTTQAPETKSCPST